MYRYISFFILFFGFFPLHGQNIVKDRSEKVLVSTDREVYIAGEWLYFNLFLITDSSSTCQNNSKYAYLILRNAKNEHVSDNLIETKGSSFCGSLFIPDTLATGIYQLVAYTNYMRNFGEEAYFTKSIVVANRFDTNLSFFDNMKSTIDPSAIVAAINNCMSVSLSKNSYRRREKVKMVMKLPEFSKDATICVSVKQVSPIGMIEKGIPSIHTKSTIADCNYLPESNGEIVQGKVLTENNNPIPKATVYLSTPDSIVNLQYSVTDKNGTFRFLLNSFYDGKSVIVKVMDFPGAKIEMEKKFSLQMPFLLPDKIIGGDIKTYLTQLQNMVNIQKSYNQYFKMDIPNGISPGYCPQVFVKPQSVVYPGDFAELPDLVEISREILPFLKTRLKNKEYTAEMLDLLNGVYVKPFIFLDGVLIDNIGQIIHLGTKSIYKIESIPYPRFFGSVYIPGILSVYTTKSDIRNMKWLLPTVTFQNVSKLTGSTYSTDNLDKLNNHTPDFRQLLYWQPSVKIRSGEEKSVEFTTSDCTGNFEIVIQGISKDGKQLEYKKVINVTSNLKTDGL